MITLLEKPYIAPLGGITKYGQQMFNVFVCGLLMPIWQKVDDPTWFLGFCE